MQAIRPSFALFLVAIATILSSSIAQAQNTLPDHPTPQPINARSCIVQPNQPVPPLTWGIRGKCLINTTFSVSALIVPALSAGFRMANPPDTYPREWKDGGEAFARNYGDQAARNTAGGLAQFAAAALVHEDPRYFASTRPGFGPRVIHAVKFTLIDKSQSGHSTLAVSNFAGAAATGFVGMAYLPPGYDDTTHAYQHSAVALGAFGAQNILYEFFPELARFAHKLHLPVPQP